MKYKLGIKISGGSYLRYKVNGKTQLKYVSPAIAGCALRLEDYEQKEKTIPSLIAKSDDEIATIWFQQISPELLSIKKGIVSVPLLVYKKQLPDDFDTNVFPSATRHRKCVELLSQKIEQNGHRTKLISFNKRKYLAWIKKQGRIDNTQSRSEWAARQWTD